MITICDGSAAGVRVGCARGGTDGRVGDDRVRGDRVRVGVLLSVAERTRSGLDQGRTTRARGLRSSGM